MTGTLSLPGRLGVSFSVSRDFDRADTARAVICFGGVGGSANVSCWQSLGPELLAGHDVAVFVAPDWAAMLGTDAGVERIAEGVAGDVHRVAELCGLELEVVTAVGYSAGCDLAVAVGGALDTVTRVVCVSGYAGGESLPGCVYLALRRRRALVELRARLRWRSRWLAFVPRRSPALTLAVAGRVGTRRAAGLLRSGVPAALEFIDELVSRRCTARFVRRIPVGGVHVEVCPVAGHTWPEWRASASRLVRPADRPGGQGAQQ
jgi:hypothetical protein